MIFFEVNPQVLILFLSRLSPLIAVDFRTCLFLPISIIINATKLLNISLNISFPSVITSDIPQYCPLACTTSSCHLVFLASPSSFPTNKCRAPPPPPPPPSHPALEKANKISSERARDALKYTTLRVKLGKEPMDLCTVRPASIDQGGLL